MHNCQIKRINIKSSIVIIIINGSRSMCISGPFRFEPIKVYAIRLDE